MGVKNTYCLVGRRNNHFEVFPEIGKSLEEIDLFTLKYTDSNELNTALSTNDYSYFVFSYNGKYYNTYNVIYSNCSSISFIVDGFINKKTSSVEKEIEKIYDDFCRNMRFSKGFRNFVEHEKNDLYQKFVDYFKGKNISSDFLTQKDGGWVKNSYPLIRSVFYILNNYPLFIEKDEISDSIQNELLSMINNNDKSLEIVQDDSSFEERLSFYESMRDDMISHGRDSYYYDQMIMLLNNKKGDVSGYQYKK